MRSAVFLLLLSATCAAQGFLDGVVFSRAFAGTSQSNNPVTMVFEMKQVQTLPDGTHITHVTHEVFYRDTLGRTRSDFESLMFGIGAMAPIHSVSVQDPLAQTWTNWQAGGSDEMPHEFSRTDTSKPARGMQVSPSQPPRGRAAQSPRTVQQQSVQAQPKSSTEQLGIQDVQGVACDATRTTTVIPVDFMGNDRPITTTNEYCMSKEFGRSLRDSMEDPRSGTHTTTLQSIVRGEPDPSLFQPPPDYTERPQQQ